ncbi:hypothetical protein LCGC14_2170100 [marine sediment metagenome]|uniref:Uncharacterized protein n=1 Tax=marine sediment metagenome TaxID=412755 RepID=A0A0F9ECH8_9ZZZZ
MGFPNTLQGDYGAWFQTGSVVLYPLGQRMLCPEGRIFRYAKVGSAGALTACQLAQAEAENAEHDAMAVQTEASSGDTSLAFTNGTVDLAENQFQYGYLSVDTAAALGVAHRVAFHAAINASTTGIVYFFEGDTIQVTISTARKVTLRKSIFKDIIVKPASDPTAIVVGVPQNAIAASSYGWVQTHGMAGVLSEDAATISEKVRPSETAVGSVSDLDASEADAADNGAVGWVCDANSAAAKNTNIFLTLEGAS